MSVNAYNIIEHFKFEGMLGRYTNKLLNKRYLVLWCKINPMFNQLCKVWIQCVLINQINKTIF